ncbi:apoptosis regulator BAX-like [Acanthaster planci]|uniref:Apoptosis regulator BAX-like n=1 Tax=Acanthaster planci TaxID=133434 RepID=A0A8B7XNT5_ACAPL|nr:apoptosis regulator BAX-like [Acanthaster planci]XP_022082474.1 apoptosis regulator BAX-like [Acanthaster planci]XP_022082475.1 apoptosis regulator BAX-like [Acanthaster planci]
MAEGGGGDGDSPMDGHDEVDDGARRFRTQHSYHEVSEQATVLLRHFIVDRFERDSVPGAPRLEDLGQATPEQEEVWRRVGTTLREIGDILDQDRELQRWINSLPTDSPIEKIIAVAQVIFGDGEIHWGRIIGLFYFAYRISVRAMESLLLQNFPGWVNQLIKEIVQFLVRRFADWIINRGGWTAIKEYFGSSNRVFRTIMILSLLTLGYGIYKLNKE